jgi:hypothetical protein
MLGIRVQRRLHVDADQKQVGIEYVPQKHVLEFAVAA